MNTKRENELLDEGDKAGYERGLKSRTCQTCGHLADCCGACANNESKYWKNEGRRELAKELFNSVWNNSFDDLMEVIKEEATKK